MKNCKKCLINKTLDSFSSRKDSIDGKDNICKKCKSLITLNFNRTKNGLISRMYNHQIESSKRRKYNLPSYTKKDLYEWVINQPIFKELFIKWEESNYDKNLIPSVDRLDDYLPYSLDNIQLKTWGFNNKKANEDQKNGILNKKNKAIKQFDINGIFIKEFYSISEASRETTICRSSISSCCINRYGFKTAGNYIWKYS